MKEEREMWQFMAEQEEDFVRQEYSRGISQLSTNIFYPFKLPQIMRLVHNTRWHHLLWPLVGKIECGWVSAHSILRSIKVNESCTTLGRVVADVRAASPQRRYCVGEDAPPDGHAPEQ